VWIGQKDKKIAQIRLGAALEHYNSAFQYYHNTITNAGSSSSTGGSGGSNGSGQASLLLFTISDLVDLYIAVYAFSPGPDTALTLKQVRNGGWRWREL